MVSGPVTSVARVEDVQIFLKDPVKAISKVLGFEQETLDTKTTHTDGDQMFKIANRN